MAKARSETMLSINRLCFTSNISFKGDTLYRYSQPRRQTYSRPQIALGGIQYHGTCRGVQYMNCVMH